MKNKIVYSTSYDFGGWGIDKRHPFDGKKFREPLKNYLTRSGVV